VILIDRRVFGGKVISFAEYSQMGGGKCRYGKKNRGRMHKPS
jgi:hypothetical protein